MANQWLTIVEYARHYAISDMTVRRRIKTGKLHAVLKDGKYFIPLDQSSPQEVHTPSSMHHKQKPITRYDHNSPHLNQGVPNQTRPDSFQSKDAEPFKHYRPKSEHLNQAKNLEEPFPRPIPQTRYEETRPTNRIQTEPKPTNQISLADFQQFCDSMLRQLSETERIIEEKYAQKAEVLELKIRERDSEISRLKQEVEDLTLLIQVIEQKSA